MESIAGVSSLKAGIHPRSWLCSAQIEKRFKTFQDLRNSGDLEMQQRLISVTRIPASLAGQPVK